MTDEVAEAIHELTGTMNDVGQLLLKLVKLKKFELRLAAEHVAEEPHELNDMHEEIEKI